MPPLTRLQMAGVARRAYPAGVAVALARARAHRAWTSNPAMRSKALGGMELVVGKTPRAHEVEALAQRHLLETFKYEEMVWRPGLLSSLRIDHLDRLRQAMEGDAGVLLNFMHQGQFAAMGAALTREGISRSVLAGPNLFGEQRPDLKGALRGQLLKTMTANGAKILSAAGSFETAVGLLRAGEVVTVASDLPGSTPVRFLGRALLVPSGVARLSMTSGAPIVVISAVPDGHLNRWEVQEALLPGDFADPQALLQAVFARHEPAVLAWPEGLQHPLGQFRLATPV